MCGTELPGHERYGHLGGWEKYRQHQTFYADNGLQNELDAWYDTVGVWLYIREYLKALGLKHTLDTDTHFTEQELVCATLHVERNREAHMRRTNPSYDWTQDVTNGSHFTMCKTIFEDLLREWCGSSLVIAKRSGKKHDIKTYTVKPSVAMLSLSKPPPNAIVRLNPTTKQHEIIMPSIKSSWILQPKGNVDAYREHHGIMMYNGMYDDAMTALLLSCSVLPTAGSKTYERISNDMHTDHDIAFWKSNDHTHHEDSPDERVRADICRTRIIKHLFS